MRAACGWPPPRGEIRVRVYLRGRQVPARRERATTEVSRSFDKTLHLDEYLARSPTYACEMQSPKCEVATAQLGDRGRYACEMHLLGVVARRGRGNSSRLVVACC